MTTHAQTHVTKDYSLRVKIIDTCGMTCTFCHNEGTPVTVDNRDLPILSISPLKDGATPIWKDRGKSGRRSIYAETNGVSFLSAPVFPDSEFIKALNKIREVFGTQEIHLTGGEPTLHPKLPEIVKAATENGFEVGMTSNGENGAKTIPPSAKAGLNRVNFSIFGTTAEELAEVQHEKFRNVRRAQVKMEALANSIEATISNGVKASANIVVLNHDHIPRVHRLLEDYSHKLSVRLLNSLDDGQSSIDAINQIFADLNAKPVANYVTAGVSGSRTAYELPDRRIIHFKQIRTVRLPETCKGCSLNNPTDCQEGYYGMRLYKARGGGYMVGVCIQRMDLCMPVDEFVKSPLCQDVLAFREQEYKELTNS